MTPTAPYSSLEGLDYNEIIFPNMGFDFHIDPTAFTVFGLSIQWYGILITIGLVLAMVFGFRNMRRVGLDPDRAVDAVIGGIIGGLVGARLYYVIFNWDFYSKNLTTIFNTREGGLAIYGGLIGAFLVGGLICRIRKVKLLPMLDICGCGFLIGQGIGRWGNFVNQEAFGANTNSIFGMSGGRVRTWIIENASSATVGGKALDPDLPVHPCFLYESVWCLIGFAILAFTLIKFRKFDGQIFLMYLAWYGLGRAMIEGLRTDSLMIGSLRVSQVLAVLCFVICTVLLIVISSKVKRMGSDYVLYCNSKESQQLLAQANSKASDKKQNSSEILKSESKNSSDSENSDSELDSENEDK